jgi:hypothetical protein
VNQEIDLAISGRSGAMRRGKRLKWGSNGCSLNYSGLQAKKVLLYCLHKVSLEDTIGKRNRMQKVSPNDMSGK